jgi:hypothetical protein
LARQASDHLEAANRKVDQVATELWKLTQLSSDLQRTLLQHTSGVLALGVVRLEDQSRREREMHALQLQQVTADPDQEEQMYGSPSWDLSIYQSFFFFIDKERRRRRMLTI